MCQRLVDVGCEAIMPWAAPIGTGKGPVNPYAMRLLRERMVARQREGEPERAIGHHRKALGRHVGRKNTDVRIGVSDSNSELRIESTLSADDVLALVKEALKNDSPLVITDTKGHSTLVPSKKIAFVEFGSAPERRVGFTTI